jgi:hypothetical protein
MNLESNYIDELVSCYFSSVHASWGDQKLLSVKLLAEIFNQYIDYAQKSKNFTDLTNVKNESDFTLALASNLLFILHLMKANDISYKDVFDEYIKHNKQGRRHPPWPEPNEDEPI